MRVRWLYVVVILLAADSLAPTQEKLARDAPAHPRPFVMPRSERERILKRVKAEAWAKAEYERVKALADKGDDFWAAFLYALEGDAKHETARKALLARYGPKSYWIDVYTKRLNDPSYFKAGQPGIPDV